MTKDMETQIWEFIDGTLGVREHQHMKELIEKDPACGDLYNRLIRLNTSLTEAEQDEPSMSFSRNIMNSIEISPVNRGMKSYASQNVIYGVAGFFIIAIAGLLIYSVSIGEMTNTSRRSGISKWLNTVDYAAILSSPMWNAFFFADIVIALYVVDGLLRSKFLTKSASKNSYHL